LNPGGDEERLRPLFPQEISVLTQILGFVDLSLSLETLRGGKTARARKNKMEEVR
jgi:hypothetical protein